MPAAGELATQVNRDLLPALRDQAIKLYFISIGTYERGVAFCDKTGEPVGDGVVVLRNESSSIALQWNGKNCRPTAQPPPCPGMHRTAGFPPELLLCDPENVTYSALDFKKGVRETFFSYDVSGQALPCLRCGAGDRQ